MKKLDTKDKNNSKLNDYFKYNYYQWATPRTLQEARRFKLVKAWRKQNREVKQNEEARYEEEIQSDGNRRSLV